LHNIQFFRAYLAKDKDSIIHLKISKNNEEKAKRDAHDNENNVNFSLVIKDKATGETRTSSVAGGYPLGVEGILDTFKLDGNTNEQFKLKLEVEVTKTKRKFCWHDYEDLIQYFQFNQPLARKGEKREFTRDDITSATEEGLRKTGIPEKLESVLETVNRRNAKEGDLLDVKGLALEMKRSVSYVTNMKKRGFEMPGGRATLASAMEWIGRNPSPCSKKKKKRPKKR
jgi:hypothetical protein